MCAICRKRLAKRDLLRLVKHPDGGLRLDPEARLPGRGAYLCPALACRNAAQLPRRLGRALGVEMNKLDRARLSADLEAEKALRPSGSDELRSTGTTSESNSGLTFNPEPGGGGMV
jgi:predicted RNA-binding protein YlxR (DUF448 family)